jgi:glyoxylase-like metal-dependent hydrolase (beta-lactamase superfamily II)
MILHTVVTGPLEVNCYLVGCEKTNRTAVIDPGGDAERIISVIDDNKLKPSHILLTHGHWDHIGAVGALKRKYGAAISLHEDDRRLYANACQQARFFGFEIDSPPPVDQSLKDGDSILIGMLDLRVIHTPGHSMGSVCFLGENEIFTGDLVFAGAFGRTDIPGGNTQLLRDSVEGKIFVLPCNTIIYPGHGRRTTVSDEKSGNSIWRLHSE